MRRSKLAGIALFALFTSSFTACGSDDDPELGSGGTAGAAGSGGSGGSGGTGGTGGSGGSSGSGGASGSSGASGAAGDDAGTDADTDGSSGDASTDADTDGSAGAAGTAGAAGAGGDAGTDAPSCVDPLNEPNESENDATEVDDTNDCDGTHTETGILTPGGDVDWYHFDGTDNLLSCTPNPKVSVNKNGVRVCVFAQCTSGTTQVVCAQGTAQKSPANRDGCCATGGTAEITLACSGLGADDADVYIRVDQPGNACVDYQVTYSY